MGTPGEVGHVYVIVRKGGTWPGCRTEVAGDRQSARLSFDAQGRPGNAASDSQRKGRGLSRFATVL
jgi:hypothetical protein